MEGKALDWSQARPDLAQVKAAGYAAVYRYVCSDLSEQNRPGKRLTATERDQILAAGLDVGLHGEDESGAFWAGYPRGIIQGAQWAHYAGSVLAWPAGRVIVAAIDQDTAGTYPAVVRDYLHGIRDGMAGHYKLGVYGSFYVVNGALAAGDAVVGVQAVAWSHGNVSTRRWAIMYQHGTDPRFGSVDYNDILARPLGSYRDPLTPDPPPPSPEVDEVKPYLVSVPSDPPHYYLVAFDLSWRREIDADTYAGLKTSPQCLPNPGISMADLVKVPTTP